MMKAMASSTNKKFSKNKGKSLTWDMLIDYTHEILFPAMDERFATKSDVSDLKGDVEVLKSDVSGIKSDVTGLRGDFEKFKDESLTNEDAILKKLDILLEEKKVADYQYEKQKKFLMCPQEDSNLRS